MPVHSSKYRKLSDPQNYQDMTDQQTVLRLVRDLKLIVATVNQAMTVAEMPIPSGLTGDFSTSGLILLSWDDVSDALRKDLDGARVWECKAADDPETDFNKNNAKKIIYSCVRTTNLLWTEVLPGDYIYWVQWINREGVISGAAGGLKGTVT